MPPDGTAQAATAATVFDGLPSPAAAPADITDAEADAREREYRRLMRKWWFGAAVGVFTMIVSYPWLFPVLRDWFPRGSPQLWYI